MRSAVVAGLGGLVLGHIVWLLAISIARGSTPTHGLILMAAALVFLGAAGIGYLAWQRYQRQQLVWASFLGALPVLPVIFTVFALAATYL